jgi:hypothetical protein
MKGWMMIEAVELNRADGQGSYYETFNDENGEIGMFDCKREVKEYAAEEGQEVVFLPLWQKDDRHKLHAYLGEY